MKQRKKTRKRKIIRAKQSRFKLQEKGKEKQEWNGGISKTQARCWKRKMGWSIMEGERKYMGDVEMMMRGEWGPETEPQYTIYQGNEMIVDKKPNNRRILDFLTVTVPNSQEGRKTKLSWDRWGFFPFFFFSFLSFELIFHGDFFSSIFSGFLKFFNFFYQPLDGKKDIQSVTQAIHF